MLYLKCLFKYILPSNFFSFTLHPLFNLFLGVKLLCLVNIYTNHSLEVYMLILLWYSAQYICTQSLIYFEVEEHQYKFHVYKPVLCYNKPVKHLSTE